MPAAEREEERCAKSESCPQLLQVQMENRRLKELFLKLFLHAPHVAEALSGSEAAFLDSMLAQREASGEAKASDAVLASVSASPPLASPPRISATPPDSGSVPVTPPDSEPAPAASPAPVVSSPDVPPSKPVALGGRAKVELFKGLFAGREDVWAKRWESGSRFGYSPVCLNLWATGICIKPKGRCSDCVGKSWAKLTSDVVYKHLSGKYVAAVFPLLADGTCRLACVDFEGKSWMEDSVAFSATLRRESVPSLLERTASGTGSRFWVFFAGPVAALDARDLMAALLAKCSASIRTLPLKSYASIRPSEGRENGGLGSSVALPLQLLLRPDGLTVFLDQISLRPVNDQWGALLGVAKLTGEGLAAALGRLRPFIPARSVRSAGSGAEPGPARETAPPPVLENGTVQASLCGELLLETRTLPDGQASEFERLASFANPEYAKAQRMGLSTWNIPPLLVCSRRLERHLSLPRGCLEKVRDILAGKGYALDVEDVRHGGEALKVSFKGTLRPGQEEALAKMLEHDMGVLSAPTAFGKTVLAAALIARRKVSTLILVHREQLLAQWKERLATFLEFEEGGVGFFGGGKKKEGRAVDVAIIQSVQRIEDPGEWMKGYGQVIVDECHHVAAFTFEKIMREVRARYVLGLTATPVRRDSLQPIIFMQCGPLRYCARQEESGIVSMHVRLRKLRIDRSFPDDVQVQEVYKALVQDKGRNAVLADDIFAAFSKGGKVLALTERLEHLDTLGELLRGRGVEPFILHGRQGAKERKSVMAALEALDENAPRVVLATGKLVGEGFDHPPLDTLVLAMPISWKGNLQQYVGRLQRSSARKSAVLVFDYVELGVGILERMWFKRRQSYEDMGYEIQETSPR